MSVPFGQQVADHGWAAGAVIAAEVIPILQSHLTHAKHPPAQVEAGDWLVVVSHSCDVLASSLDQEPFVEVLHCRPIPKLRSQFKEIRSTRTLDFRPNRTSHEQLVLSAHAVADRYAVPRAFLRDHPPANDRRFDENAVVRVLAWYQLRYGRPSWPDQFVTRLGRPTAVKLQQTLEPLRNEIAEVRVAILPHDRDLPDGEDYRMTVYFVVDERLWSEDAERRTEVVESFDEFMLVLVACNGIVVDKEKSQVVSGCDFSWQMLRSTDQWNFANLSHRD